MSVDGVEITGAIEAGFDEILTDDALALLADLHRTFESTRQELLAARERRYAELADGGTLGLPRRDRARPRAATGRSRPRRRDSRTAASRSPVRPTAR